MHTMRVLHNSLFVLYNVLRVYGCIRCVSFDFQNKPKSMMLFLCIEYPLMFLQQTRMSCKEQMEGKLLLEIYRDVRFEEEMIKTHLRVTFIQAACKIKIALPR